MAKQKALGRPPAAAQAEQELSDDELRRQLLAELDELVERARAVTADYEPPPFSSRPMTALIEDNLRKLPKEIRSGILDHVRRAIEEKWFSAETWKGLWYMVNYTAQYNAGLVKRRLSGEYVTDDWGLDWEFLDMVRPFLIFLYKAYWRVKATGLENIPIEGRALLVANHSGQIPWDGMMMTTAILLEHPAQRLARILYSDLVPQLPFLSTWLVRLGQTLASLENGIRLLEQDELVAVFPEGCQGIGKLYKERYHLARFGQGDFVKMALHTRAPVIPVSIVGAEETYISLTRSQVAARVTGLPYVPITPTFPWLGLLGLVPLPTRWYIDFGEPILMVDCGPDAADNLVLVSQLAGQVRNTVQEMVDSRLAQRRSVFLG